jgi:6,7-dimethyl-8-ribityllumazine synthase
MRHQHQTRAGSNRPQPDRHGVSLLAPLGVADARIAVIASTFNAAIVDQLTDGALGALRAQGVTPEQITFVQVPGAWELPQIAERLADAGNHHAIVALGCVIRGETSHYEVIVNESARGLMQVALMYGLPVTNGVLACATESQAQARAGGSAGNKGAEAADAALELLGVVRAVAAGA